MIQRLVNFITVVDVIRKHGYKTSTRLDTAVGQSMARWWYANTNGEEMEKGNRQKTNGSGSHAKALYPQFLELKILGFVKMHKLEMDNQGEFPFMGE